MTSKTHVSVPIGGPIDFPLGEKVFSGTPLYAGLFAHVDRLLDEGQCPNGRLDIETEDVRLTCLIHKSKSYLAGITDGSHFSGVALYDFARRAAELGSSATCSLYATETALVVMVGVHFSKRPSLQASTKLVDPAYLMRYLAQEGRDAAVAFERDGSRSLLFLNKGVPARLYFGPTHQDPGSGTLLDKLRDYAFSPLAPASQVEVFSDLKLAPDPDAGVRLAKLAASIEPPPPVTVHVHFDDGREVRQRPFMPPEMIIGRDPSVDLFIDNLAVSRRHATLRWERGEFVIEDLSSANGTNVNDQPVGRQVVVPGDRIGIGKFEVMLARLPSAPRAQETVFMPLSQLTSPAFLVGDGVRLELDDDLVLGKGPAVDVQIKGFFVGAAHARIHVDAAGALRLSCFGHHRVRFNGAKVREARLSFDDVFEIGRSRFTIATTAEGQSGSEAGLS